MGRKAVNLIGQKFGNLTVLERDFSKKSKNAYWICKCDCGNITSVQGSSLRKGRIKSCGCLFQEIITPDLTNQKFGRLKVLKRDFSQQKGYAYWICQCDCGNIVSIKGSNLKTGTTQSCGCLQKERTSEKRLIDLTGQKFGHLTVLKRDTLKKGKVYWICKCDCGSTVSIRYDHLRSGGTISCGCIKSKGEKKIKDILSLLKINFIQQKTFNNLKNKSNLKFDFFLPDYNCCIEYQGEQHYRAVEYFGGEEEFKKQKERDNIKKQWCKENNIKLIEIPYWDFDKIDKDYLKQLI